MKFSQVVGHEKIKSRLTLSAREGRIPHAQLFHGPEGSGNLPLALAYAQYISCPNRTDTDSCGMCPSCKKHQDIQFADLHFSFPVFNKEKGGSVSTSFYPQWRKALGDSAYLSLHAWRDRLVSDNKQLIFTKREANDILSRLSLTAFEGGYKFMIVWMAEMINEKTANVLLKMIEEPPRKTVIILVASSTEQMLPTILSRLQTIQVPKLSDEEVRSGLVTHLGQTDPSKIDAIVNQADGNFWRAIELTSSGNEVLLEELANFMRNAYMGDFTQVLAWSNKLHVEGREHMKDFLEYALHFVRQCLVNNYKSPELVRFAREEADFAKNFAPFINQSNVIELVGELEKAYYDVVRNVHGKMVLFDLSIKFNELLKRQKPQAI